MFFIIFKFNKFRLKMVLGIQQKNLNSGLLFGLLRILRINKYATRIIQLFKLLNILVKSSDLFNKSLPLVTWQFYKLELLRLILYQPEPKYTKSGNITKATATRKTIDSAAHLVWLAGLEDPIRINFLNRVIKGEKTLQQVEKLSKGYKVFFQIFDF